MNTLIPILSLIFTSRLVLAQALIAHGPLKADYPVQDVVVSDVAAWSSLYGKNLINTSPNSQMLASPDWTKDARNCIVSTHYATSFDDGPSNPTPNLLSELKKRNIKTTFFVVGSRVLDQPDILKQAFAEGHQIGIHTWSHSALTTITNEQIVAELLYTARIIKEVIGVTPRFMRPPYGDIDDRVRSVLKSLNMIAVLWSFDSGDSAGSMNVVSDVNAHAQLMPKSGPIALEHDLTEAQASQAPGAMDGIMAAGYKLVRLDECLGQAAYNEGLWAGLPADGVLAPKSVSAPVVVPLTPIVPPPVQPAAATPKTVGPNPATPKTVDPSPSTPSSPKIGVSNSNQQPASSKRASSAEKMANQVVFAALVIFIATVALSA
ncbi:hypothetical protein BASA61_009781 [Batrachochytrium salamandrivorans]|nr:hypothetical protein BASA61_009781 [Batrachochytrium salamandrivorans]